MGMFYKLNAYFDHWNMAFEENSLLLKLAVVSLATIEFIIGIYLFLGIRKRFTSIVTLLLMLAMTMITVYIYAYQPVADCGCFGEAFTLSNRATLAKNLLLGGASLVIVAFPHYMKRLISERNQWLTSIYSWLYIIALSLLSLHYLPAIDFMPFRKGTDLRAAWYGNAGDNTPAELVNLSFFRMGPTNAGEDMTEEILNDTGYTFLLTMPKVRIADSGCNDRINDLYDDCIDRDFGFYAIVADNTDEAAINSWTDQTGAAYPFLSCDATLLKAMVRSNPGLMLIKDGTVINKWSNNNLPVLAEDKEWNKNEEGPNLPLIKLILWFIVPLSAIIMIDGIWIGSKYFKHYILKKTLKSTDHEKENCSR